MPAGASRLASMASGFMAGCLIFQRPDICSTTSLESIRTSIAAPGANSSASLSPAIRPEYSATLLLATPMVVPSSAMTSPVTASFSTAPYAAGPGLPREPPSASMTTEVGPLTVCPEGHSPDSGVRTRMRWHSSCRITSSGAALRIAASSVGSRESRQPLHSRARRAPTATPFLDVRSRS